MSYGLSFPAISHSGTHALQGELPQTPPDQHYRNTIHHYAVLSPREVNHSVTPFLRIAPVFHLKGTKLRMGPFLDFGIHILNRTLLHAYHTDYSVSDHGKGPQFDARTQVDLHGMLTQVPFSISGGVGLISSSGFFAKVGVEILTNGRSSALPDLPGLKDFLQHFPVNTRLRLGLSLGFYFQKKS